jgi:hypothetical protein
MVDLNEQTRAPRDYKASQAHCEFGPQAGPGTQDQVGQCPAGAAEGEEMSAADKWVAGVGASHRLVPPASGYGQA